MPDEALGRTVRVYSRPGCHLCDELLTGLAPICASFEVTIDVVDISGSLALERDYGLSIPVVELDGRELCRHRLDAAASALQYQQLAP